AKCHGLLWLVRNLRKTSASDTSRDRWQRRAIPPEYFPLTISTTLFPSFRKSWKPRSNRFWWGYRSPFSGGQRIFSRWPWPSAKAVIAATLQPEDISRPL